MKVNKYIMFAAAVIALVGSLNAESAEDYRLRTIREANQKAEEIRKESKEQAKEFYRIQEERKVVEAINRNTKEIARMKAEKARIESNKKKSN